uniref:Putative conserved plasma membrane protein n=1 Tax=Xenopsylla cheopis TaxID=163159 RepID=A0A6M2DGM9_XENCH
MTNCFENISIPPCIWFEAGDKRNTYASIIAGLLFFSGWWILIDAASVYPGSLSAAHHICGVFGTISLFMVNSVSNAQVLGDAYSGGCMGPRGARAWLFLGFVIGFASVIAACWIMFADFVSAGGNGHTYPGVGLLLQNLLIFLGSLVYKFGRSEELWG